MSAAMMAVLILFLALLLLGAPVAFVLGIASVAWCLLTGQPEFLYVLGQRSFAGIDSFVLLAIPLFIAMGEIMNRAGMTERLVDFAMLLVGRLRGGLAQVNVVSSTLFAGITGSALSDTAALGSMLIPAMKRTGYDGEFSTAVTAASAIQGPIIPPSIPAVLIASAAGISVGGLFLGGAVPGVLIGVACMIVVAIQARRRNYPRREGAVSFRQALKTTGQAALTLITPLIVLGGILTGAFTPTEAAAVAVAYSVAVGVLVMRTVGLRDLGGAIRTTVTTTAKIYLIIATANVFSWVLSVEGVPSAAARWLTGLDASPLMVMLAIQLFVLFWGMWMDTAPSIVILAPILFPIAIELGFDPLHFGVAFLVNLMIGQITPPFGMTLFTALAVGKVTLQGLLRELWPFLILDLAVLALVTLLPNMALYLPKVFDLM